MASQLTLLLTLVALVGATFATWNGGSPRFPDNFKVPTPTLPPFNPHIAHRRWSRQVDVHDADVIEDEEESEPAVHEGRIVREVFNPIPDLPYGYRQVRERRFIHKSMLPTPPPQPKDYTV